MIFRLRNLRIKHPINPLDRDQMIEMVTKYADPPATLEEAAGAVDAAIKRSERLFSITVIKMRDQP